MKPGNWSGSKDDLHLQSNKSVPALMVLSVEFSVSKRNSTNNVLSTAEQGIGTEPPYFIQNESNPDEVDFLVSPSKWKLPKIGALSMRSLYFVASFCLLVLLLLVIRLLVNRRREKKEYSLVTKGDFEA